MTDLKLWWFCSFLQRHQWDRTEAEARGMVFIPLTCERCGTQVDGAALLALLENPRYARIRGQMLRSFKKA